MALNKAIITPAESDVFLALESTWLALGDTIKVDHIAKASVYIQGTWDCALAEVDWDDDTTIPEDIQEACAWYAYASYSGNLYSEVTDTEPSTRSLLEVTDEVGSLRSTLKYSPKGRFEDTVAPLGYPNALMSSLCTRSVSGGGAGSKKVIRV